MKKKKFKMNVIFIFYQCFSTGMTNRPTNIDTGYFLKKDWLKQILWQLLYLLIPHFKTLHITQIKSVEKVLCFEVHRLKKKLSCAQVFSYLQFGLAPGYGIFCMFFWNSKENQMTFKEKIMIFTDCLRRAFTKILVELYSPL